ncbi:hypothetical protein HOC11_08990 [archaeon]|jgi:predicted transcriptional regulator|nr:hypothetical protein [archaeon]
MGDKSRAIEVEYSDFTILLGENPRIKLIDFMLQTREFDYDLTSIAEGANINRQTAREIINDLLDKGILIVTGKLGKSTLYQLNEKSKIVVSMIQFFDEILKEKVQKTLHEINA